ncbi:MAG: hypothetical protein Q8P05_06105 [Candidatus Diapherotrites archaeon]|nr:hypothetical protein [Candidatus Diapherotrites archaeon]
MKSTLQKIIHSFATSEETFEEKSKNEEKSIHSNNEKELKKLLEKCEKVRQLLFESIQGLFYKNGKISWKSSVIYEYFLVENLDASRIIEDLALKGSLGESVTILRANYERMLRVVYCLDTNNFDLIQEMIEYGHKPNYSQMERHLRLNLYSSFSKIAHSNTEKLMLPFQTYHRKGLANLKKTTRNYDPKVTRKVLEFNIKILARSFAEYYNYLNNSEIIYSLEEFENNKTKTLLENIKKVEQIVTAIN